MYDKETITLVTGGFDPLHSGHIAYLKEASKLGDKLVVGLNSDEWLTRKKGRPFLNFKERAEILESLEMVDSVLSFDDSDGSARGAIFKLKSTEGYGKKIIFANGGDRDNTNTPELVTYGEDPQVEFAYGVGGYDKKNSSRWILEEWKQPKVQRNWGWYRVLQDRPGYKIKELVISPGKSLSMQKHKLRSENWYVLKGTCHIKTDGVAGIQENKVEPHSTFSIGKEVWHQGQNKTNYFCHILEVQYGEACVEEDIERRYGGGFTVDEMVTATKNIMQN